MADFLQYMGPNTAAFFAGGQLADQQAADALKREESLQDILTKQQSYRFAEDKHPLELEGKRYTNEGLRLGNVEKDLGNQLKGGTLQSDIKAKNTANADAISQHHVAQAQRLAQVAEQSALRFGHIKDPMQRSLETAQFFKANGFDAASDPDVGQFLQMDPQQLIASSKAIAKHAAENSREYQQGVAVADIQGKASVEGHRLSANATVEAARSAAEARKAVATARQTTTDFWTTYYTKLKTARDKHAALMSEAAKLRATGLDEDLEAAKRMVTMAEEIRPQAEAEIKAATPGSINAGAVSGLPTNPAPSIAPPGGAARPQPAASAANSEVGAAAKKAWGSYEPDKYDYQIRNGELYRKEKGKK